MNYSLQFYLVGMLVRILKKKQYNNNSRNGPPETAIYSPGRSVFPIRIFRKTLGLTYNDSMYLNSAKTKNFIISFYYNHNFNELT